MQYLQGYKLKKWNLLFDFLQNVCTDACTKYTCMCTHMFVCRKTSFIRQRLSSASVAIYTPQRNKAQTVFATADMKTYITFLFVLVLLVCVSSGMPDKGYTSGGGTSGGGTNRGGLVVSECSSNIGILYSRRSLHSLDENLHLFKTCLLVIKYGGVDYIII